VDLETAADVVKAGAGIPVAETRCLGTAISEGNARSCWRQRGRVVDAGVEGSCEWEDPPISGVNT